jgi:integrase
MAVPAALIEMLADQLARRSLTGADADAFVFVMPDGEPLRYENWRRRVWLPAVAAASLGSLTFHDLRRACASGMVADRVDVKTTQTRLGHSDPRLTLAVYAQAMSDSDRSVPDHLGDRFMAPSRGVLAEFAPERDRCHRAETASDVQ